MEKGFDFGALLKKSNEQKHKSKPVQFVSVAGGVQKRLTSNIKQRKSNRLTIFDSIRNLEKPETVDPAPISEARLKQEHRKQQLEKWKEEKEKKKKEAAALKKKPFVTGVAHSSLTFVPPPPPHPSTSGRVTRSQTARSIDVKQRGTSSRSGKSTQSFAPKNALFRAPEIKNLIKLPVLAPLSRTKNKSVSSTVSFDPILPNVSKQTRSRTAVHRQAVTDIKMNNPWSKPQIESRSARGKFTARNTKYPVESNSSSSDIETSSNLFKRVKTPYSGKGIQKAINNLPVKVLILQSSSSEKSSSDTEPLETTSTSRRVRHSSNKIKVTIQNQGESSSDKLNNDCETLLDETSTQNAFALPKKSNTEDIESGSIVSSSEKLSSGSEVAVEKSPVITNNRQRKSLQQNTPKNRIPKSESTSEEKLRSPKSPLQSPLTPEQTEAAKISPCVTFSRGKDNARKEMKWKIDEGLLDDDASDIENVDHFRRQLDSEITRLTQVCSTWDKISEQTQLPDSVQEALLAAVGQARLLMSQKMQQFASLVERCERPEPGSALVTPADLLGFWDMVFMQVENVDMRFKKLEEMRARGWREEQPAEQPQQRVQRAHAGRRAARPAAAAAAPSRMRKMIAAARRALKEQDSQSTISSPGSSSDPSEPDTDRAESKVFEAGFFMVRSPVRSPAAGAAPAPATPAGKPSLLKAVLSSEAQKASASKSSASFAMLRASILGKSVECDGVAPLPLTPVIMTPINLFATPGRSILKSANTPSANKSIKVVLFDDSDQDETFLSLAAEGVASASSCGKSDTSALNVEKILVENQFDNENSTTAVVNNERETSEKTVSVQMDDDNDEEQKDTSEKPVLVRQDAVEISSPIFNSRRKANPIPNCTVMTRSRRKSLKNDFDGKSPEQALESGATLTQVEENKSHARRKSKAFENIVNTSTSTPRQSGRKKSVVDPVNAAEDEENVTVKTPRQSGRKKAAKEAINVSTEEEVIAKTPRKLGQKKKALQEADVNVTTEVDGKAAMRSTRKKALDEEADVSKPTPQGSTRRRKTARLHSLDTEH